MCQRSLLYQDGEMIEHYLAARNEITGPGSPFAVTTEVVRGVTLKSFAAAPPNMRSMWEMSAAHGDNDYLVYEDERFTYNEVHAMVRKLAQHLVAQGVGSGTRVALAMRNYPEWVVGYWATISIGAAAVGMNAWWTAPEMEYALNDSAPLVMIADDERLERFQQLILLLR